MTPRLLCLTLPFALLLGACQREEIRSYRIAKEKDSAQAQAQAAAPKAEMPPGHPEIPPGHPPISGTAGSVALPGPQAGMGEASPSAGLVWTAPAHWNSKPLGQMRRGSYSIKSEAGIEADLSIFVFPGAAGGLIDNINRWRGQIGLQPIEAARLADETTTMKSDSGLDIVVVDMAGPAGERITGAVLERGSESWFFKLRGPDAHVAKQKADFVAFLKTVKLP